VVHFTTMSLLYTVEDTMTDILWEIKRKWLCINEILFWIFTLDREILTVDLASKRLQIYCYTNVGGEIVLRHMLLHSPPYTGVT